MKKFYFVQFTDVHIGLKCSKTAECQAELNLKEAIRDANHLVPRPSFALGTGDLGNAGYKDVIRYACLMKSLKMRRYDIPASHDLAKGTLGKFSISFRRKGRVWERLFGAARHSFEHEGVRFLLLEPFHITGKDKWQYELSIAESAWLKRKLDGAKGRPVIIAMHTPFMVDKNGKYRPELLARQLFELLSGHRVVAIIAGHRHRNDEYRVKGINQIQSGSLLGLQCTALPHFWLSTYPGYRLFYWDGKELHSLWRELTTDIQVTLESIGGVHTLGPRPQVRPVSMEGAGEVFVKAYAPKDKVVKVEYSVQNHEWIPLRKSSHHLWTEWKGAFSTARLSPGPYVMIAYARTASGKEAYDSVPMVVSRGKGKTGAVGAPEILFGLTTTEAEADCVPYNRQYGIPWREICTR